MLHISLGEKAQTLLSILLQVNMIISMIVNTQFISHCHDDRQHQRHHHRQGHDDDDDGQFQVTKFAFF